MRFKELSNRPLDEIDKIVGGIQRKMTDIGFEKLALYMRDVILHKLPDKPNSSYSDKDFKAELLNGGNCNVSFEGGKLIDIDIYYNYHDSIRAVLTAAGFNIRYEYENGDREVLYEIDGFDEFLDVVRKFKYLRAPWHDTKKELPDTSKGNRCICYMPPYGEIEMIFHRSRPNSGWKDFFMEAGCRKGIVCDYDFVKYWRYFTENETASK